MITVYKMLRDTDVSGVSGEGEVAHAVEFEDGTVVVRWLGATPSTVIWEGPDGLERAVRVHGHNGATRFVPVGIDAEAVRRLELVA